MYKILFDETCLAYKSSLALQKCLKTHLNHIIALWDSIKCNLLSFSSSESSTEYSSKWNGKFYIHIANMLCRR